ncbi:YrbL family protein [Larsenimonas salina]|uniref:YrbL family protein n=1 Tax=Larsenimonas salina TaxID=1295565 RepID=UPI002073A5E2|nr:YrbL family protein [Larsenimonas salina]
MNDKQQILKTLAHQEPIGQGNDRVVYQLECSTPRCLKLPRYPKRGSEQNLREKRYFSYLEARNVPYWHFIPKYYGSIYLGGRGEGLIFDLILDKGAPAKTLKFYRESKPELLELYRFQDALLELCVFLYSNWIIPSDINDRNIVCVIEDQNCMRLFLIDGVSNPAFLPIANYSKWFAQRRIKKRLRKLLGKFSRAGLITDNQSHNIVAKLN